MPGARDWAIGKIVMNAAAALDDFPERLSPMMVKEFRQGLRAKMFVVPFLIIHLLTAFIVSIEYLEMSAAPDPSSGYPPRYYYSYDPFERIFGPGGITFYLMIGAMTAIFMPLAAYSAMQAEIGGRNAELLLLATVSRWRIVLGKWLVAASLTLLTFLSLVPYFLVRYLLGGLELGYMALWIGVIAILAVMMNAVVLGASSYANHFGRLLVVALVLGSLFGCLMVAGASYAATAGAFTGSSGPAWNASAYLGLANIVVLPLLFTALSLQLARARLRLYENPYEVPQSRLIIILLFCMPFLLGAVGLMTLGWGTVPVAALAAWCVLAMDRSSARKLPAAPAASPSPPPQAGPEPQSA
ncbi:MAG: ABC transporter permease [Verrucomicrobiales bacterium]